VFGRDVESLAENGYQRKGNKNNGQGYSPHGLSIFVILV
jgi:hypothetical protein